MTDTPTKIRFRALDAWRGVCALMVALFHFDAVSDFSFSFVTNSWIFVDFFFVLSGFVITHGYLDQIAGWRSAAAFVVRRFARLWPLHIAMLLALVALELVKLPLGMIGLVTQQGGFDGLMSLATLPREIVLLNAWGTDQLYWNTPSWSIGAEFYTYLVFALVMVLARRYWLVPACLATIAAYVLVTHSSHYIDTAFDYGIFRCIYGFFVGHLLYRFWRNRSHDATPALATNATLIEAITLAVVVAFVCAQAPDPGPLSMLAPFVFGGAIYVFSAQAGRISALLLRRPLQNLGLWSYSIYMVHYPFVVGLNRLVKAIEQKTHITLTAPIHSGGETVYSLFFVNTYVMDFAAIVYLACVVAISSWTYRLIENPGRRAFAGLVRRIEGS